jgi:TFIIB zinc-binding
MNAAAVNTVLPSATLSSSSASAPSASQQPNAPAIWDFDTPMLHAWVQKSAPLHVDPNVSEQLWSQLLLSLEALRETVETVDPDRSNGNGNGNFNDEDGEAEQMDGPESRRKRRKKVVTIRTLHDPYHLWISAWKDRPPGDGPSQVLGDDADDMPSTTGGKITQLTLGGMINAVLGVVGGVTHQTVPSLAAIKARHAEIIAANGGSTTTALSPTVTLLDGTALYEAAARLHRACATRIQADVLRTTPLRIQDMLASDLSPQEFAGIRKRIVDTVVRGKGRALLVEDEADDLAVAPPAVAANAQSTAEKYQKCGTCGNQDQATFVLDRKNGDIICSNCGTVVSESLMHEGSQYRKFEGEVDRNHHGDAANPLFSNAQNMSTSLGGTTMTTMSRGMGGGGGKSNLETILRNAHAYTELNLSNFGRSDRRTRTGYKDKQKKEAFVQMAHVGDALNLHEAVIQRAKELFAGFRDDRELVQQFKGVIGKSVEHRVLRCEQVVTMRSVGSRGYTLIFRSLIPLPSPRSVLVDCFRTAIGGRESNFEIRGASGGFLRYQ